MPSSSPKLVLGVGASAGGLDAFKRLLAALKPRRGLALLLVQHLAPDHESHLGDLLTPHTDMTVRDAHQGLELEANTVYIIRPDTALAVKNGTTVISTPTPHRGVRLPVDHLFRSLAREYGSRSVGIVLSGAGSDGSIGARAIKAAGGLVIVQEPATSGQPGMPRSAIATGAADAVVEIDQIPSIVDRFLRLPRTIEPTPRPESDELRLDETSLRRLTAILKAQRGFDLRVYKPATIERRALRRLTLAGIEDVPTYLRQVRDDPDEQRHLIRDLLISVTDFFRDHESFRALRELVVDPLVTDATEGATLRVWVPGCATGEEAYSIGIELLEALRDHGRRARVQIFATDVDEAALGVARQGIYPPAIAERMPSRRLETYFKPVDGRGYQVRPQLRDTISFAVHDLTKDPPFSRMNLVSCRNVLIYLTNDAQQHVLSVLHFALVQEGHLFLSTSESTGAQRDHFSTISKPHRIYRRVGNVVPVAMHRSRPRGERGLPHDSGRRRERAPRRNQAQEVVLAAVVPPTVVVNAEDVVTFTHGELSPFLQIPQGESPRLELREMLRADLATRTRGAVFKARRTGEISTTVVPAQDDAPGVLVTARPAPTLGDATVILTFETKPEAHVGATSEEGAAAPREDVIVEQLEAELRATQEDLRNTVEELETSNEELRSSNEESMSMNEELQSANEELEATTEELRSLNEELTTVNGQLREKVTELEEAHDDLRNFLASTKIATVFLDEQLCIKRFTPAAKDLLNIGDADRGRFAGDIARSGLQHELVEEARRVLEHLVPVERELRVDERWVCRTVLPYRTGSRRIEGIVVTFNDITDLRTTNAELKRRTQRLDLAWEVARGGVYEHRVPLDDSTYVSDHWAQLLGLTRVDLPASRAFLHWMATRTHPDDRERVEGAYRDFVDGRTMRYDVQLRLRHADGRWVWVRGISRALERDAAGRVTQVLGMMQDITKGKRTELVLRESEARFRAMTDGLPLIVWVHEAEGKQEMVNQAFCDFFGVRREDVDGGTWQMLLHPEDADGYLGRFEESVQRQVPFHAEARVRHGDGSWRWIESWGQPRHADDGTYLGFVGTSADITERHATTEALAEAQQRFHLAKDAAALGIYDVDLRTGEFRWDDRMCELWGYDHGCPGTVEILAERIHPDDRPIYEAALAEAQKVGGVPTFSVEVRVVLWDKPPERWAAIDGIVTFAGVLPGRLVATVQDITEAKLAEQRKDDYLAMLSHELRNPLSAIRSAGELIRQSMEPDAPFQAAVGVLERQAGHMAKLLEGLLDVSRISRGKLSADRRPLDLASLLRMVLDDRRAGAEAKGITLHERVAAGPLPVNADRDRLQQVFDNLLGNALKFTGQGGEIWMEARQETDRIVVSVRDTGEGFSEDLGESLFEPFLQGPQGLARASGGLGLGLALAKGLVELHEGTIEASSPGVGQGAELVVRLPLGPPVSAMSGTSVEAPPSGAPRDLRILVVEDNHDFAAMLEEVLVLEGHEVQVVHDARAGLRAIADAAPDIVLCDLGLPSGMSGYELASQVRAQDATRGLPVVAVSGYGRPEDKRRALEAGFDAHVSKPVEVRELSGLIGSLVATRSETAPPDAEG